MYLTAAQYTTVSSFPYRRTVNGLLWLLPVSLCTCVQLVEHRHLEAEVLSGRGWTPSHSPVLTVCSPKWLYQFTFLPGQKLLFSCILTVTCDASKIFQHDRHERHFVDLIYVSLITHNLKPFYMFTGQFCLCVCVDVCERGGREEKRRRGRETERGGEPHGKEGRRNVRGKGGRPV